MSIAQITTTNTEWLNTTVKSQIVKDINKYFNNPGEESFLIDCWYEMIEDTNPKLSEELQELIDNPPCLGSDLWWYLEHKGQPSGSDILINSMVESYEINEKYPDWNNPKLKHLGTYWTNPYKDEITIEDDFPIISELLTATKNSLKENSLWEITLTTEHDINETNAILQDLYYETTKNITLDTINQPREINEILKVYPECPHFISYP